MGYPPEEVSLPKMNENPEYNRVREEIVGFEYCYQWCGNVATTCTKQGTCPAFQNKDSPHDNKAKHSIAKTKADKILKIKGIAILSDDQSKPQNPYYRVSEGNDRVMPEDTPEEFAYGEAQQDMKNFRRIVDGD